MKFTLKNQMAYDSDVVLLQPRCQGPWLIYSVTYDKKNVKMN